MQELRVDRNDAPLTLLLEFYDAVNGRQDPVAKEFLAALPQRVTVYADELQEPVLERVGRERKLGAQRHGGRHLGRFKVDAHRLRQFLRLLSVQAMLAVQGRSDVRRVL